MGSEDPKSFIGLLIDLSIPENIAVIIILFLKVRKG